MSLSAPEVVESSRAGQEAEQEASRAGQEAEQEAESEPQRKWVALVSIPVLLGNCDERAQELGLGTDVLLDLHDPPLPSYLVLHPRVAPFPRRNNEPLSAYILAADRSALLFQVIEGNRPYFFLCDTHRRTVTILPPAAFFIRPRLSIGLIADPQHPGHYVVAQLHRNSPDDPMGLLCYSTNIGRRWFIRGLTLVQQDRMRNPFSETGVVAHDGRLWWLALAYGLFFYNHRSPLIGHLQLHYVPLPDNCEMDRDVDLDPRIRTLIDQRRCVRPSEGKLRFVEIRGLSYDEVVDVSAAPNPTVWMWTLDNLEGPNPWTFEYEVAFSELWDNATYAKAGLLRGEVPHVAFVDPSDHHVVYFFQGSKLFGLDMLEKKVVDCKECLIDRDQLRFPSSRPIVDAWVVPGDDDSDNVWSTQSYHSYVEEKKREVPDAVGSWLQARLETEWTSGMDESDELESTEDECTII